VLSVLIICFSFELHLFKTRTHKWKHQFLLTNLLHRCILEEMLLLLFFILLRKSSFCSLLMKLIFSDKLWTLCIVSLSVSLSLSIYIYIHSLVFRPRPRSGRNQSPVMGPIWPLAHCILGKLLGVVCHCFPPPLDVPTFVATYIDAELQSVLHIGRVRKQYILTARLVKVSELWDVTPWCLFWRTSLHRVRVVLGNTFCSK